MGQASTIGLDIAKRVFQTHGADATGRVVFRKRLMRARVLEFPVPTVAAIPGPVFAAGARIALAHDFRVMRADRGFFCLPEVDINIPFTPGMAALIQSRLTPATAHEAMTTGRRYGGTDAQAAGLVDEAVPEAEVLPRAVARAKALTGKNPQTLAAIKAQMYTVALTALRAD